METHTVPRIQETRQKTSKYGCNIKRRHENHQANYRDIECLYVGRKGAKVSDTETESLDGYILQHMQSTWGLSQFTQGSNEGILNTR